MNVFQWYMFRRLALHTALITAVLTIVVLACDPFELAGLWTLGTLPLGRLALANILAIPTLLCQTGPIGVTIATIALYCRWISDHQILSLRNAGLSNWSIAAPGIAVGAIATIFMAVVTLYLMAATFPTFEDIIYVASSRFPYHSLTPRYLNYVGPDVALSFERWTSSNTVEDVQLFDWRNASATVDIHAENAEFIESEAGDFILMSNGSYSRRHTDGANAEPVAFEEMSVMVRPHADVSSRELISFEQRIDRLIDPPPEIREQPGVWPGWMAEGHQRVITPLLCLNYVALSLGVLLTMPQTRSPTIWRLAALALGLTLLHYGKLIMHKEIMLFPGLLPLFYVFAIAPAAAGAALVAWRDRVRPSQSMRSVAQLLTRQLRLAR
jgi:lipopolysaccharide export system permease protein